MKARLPENSLAGLYLFLLLWVNTCGVASELVPSRYNRPIKGIRRKGIRRNEGNQETNCSTRASGTAGMPGKSEESSNNLQSKISQAAEDAHSGGRSAEGSLVESISDNALRVLEAPSKQVRIWHNRTLAFLTKHNLNVITVGLLLCSIYFFASVQPVRNRMLSNNPELFSDGQEVKVTRVIDGDELRIENSQGSTRLRILGIMSFDASANDFTVSEIGKVCVDYLESNYVGKQVRLEVSPVGVDNEGRLLGTLFLQEDDGAHLDIGRDLVAKGMTLVFLRYGFERMNEYVNVQNEARSANLGLWSSDRVTARADSMLRLWEQERKQDENSKQGDQP